MTFLYFISIMEFKMKDKKPGKKSLGIANPSTKVSANRKWTVFVIISSFVSSVLFSAVTTTMLDKLGLTWAFVILLVIIAISIIYTLWLLLKHYIVFFLWWF